MDDTTFALALAHGMLRHIEAGGWYSDAEWDRRMGQIEYELDMPTERAKAYATDHINDA